MDKSPDAFRTISEVAAWLETPTHVLRFWESRFDEIKPVKRAGGRRYYRPEDMQLLGGIKHLLHTEGHTIKAVQDRLKAEGTAKVAALSPPMNGGAAPGAPAADETAASGGSAQARAAATADDESGAPAAGQPPTIDPAPAPAAAPPESLAPDRAAPEDAPPMPSFASRARRARPPRPSPAPNAPEAEETATATAATAAETDTPPIGFFFDDSDEADPAEEQSGSFLPAPEALPGADARHEDPRPEAARTARRPAPTTPPDPDDDVPGLAPPLGMAAWLRGLAPGDLPPAARARLAEVDARLRAVARTGA